MNKYKKSFNKLVNPELGNGIVGKPLHELVEKATLKKTIYKIPKNSKNNMKFHYCPNCKKHTGLSRYPFCSTCGQALDWNDE